MNLSSLEIFCSVAAEHSVTRAAAQLARVQSNVTTRVQQLEEELNVQLFSRDGKRMTLTSSGHRFLGYAQRLLTLAEEARQAMSDDGPLGRLRIGTMESTAAARLPALLSSYHSRWPAVDLEISIGTSESLVDDVASSTVDCAFVAVPGADLRGGSDFALESRGLASTRAYIEDLLLVLPPNHPAVKGPDDLKITTLAAFANGCTYRCTLERWLCGSRNPAHTYWKVLEQTSYHAILSCVGAGSCFALCPRSILDLQRVPMDVRTYPIASIDTHLVYRSSCRSAALDELLRALQYKPVVASRKRETEFEISLLA
jgi:DNA-binding transcriptional LysR family regulator